MKSRLEFKKFVGAGNDFIFIDLRQPLQKNAWRSIVKTKNRASVARKLCDRLWGVGADGLVIVESHPDLDFKWDFYNSDGSRAEMCGNAARCAIVFESEKNKGEIRFETSVGIVRGQRLGPGSAEVYLNVPRMLEKDKIVLVNGKKLVGDYINSGVPHFVIQARWNFKDLPSREVSRQILLNRAFLPKHTNVTYVTRFKGKIITITYERGVYDFTKACGTGAVAAAYSLSQGLRKRVGLETPGGKLSVDFFNYENHCRLSGSAVHTFTGFLTKEQIT